MEIKVTDVQEWFLKHVKCEGEPYVLDAEQAAAVVEGAQNVLATARAGSGKTRTIVAKLVYMLVRLNYRIDELLVFVFNRAAAKEVNERLAKMTVDDALIVEKAVEVATTFHAFAYKIVYQIGKEREKWGKLLMDEAREKIIEEIIDEIPRSAVYEFFRENEYVTVDGRRVESYREKVVEDWLFEHVAKCEREKLWKKLDVEMTRREMEDVIAKKVKKMVRRKAERWDKQELMEWTVGWQKKELRQELTQLINRAEQHYGRNIEAMSEEIRRYIETIEEKNRRRRMEQFYEWGKQCYERYWDRLEEGEECRIDFCLMMQRAAELIRLGKADELLVQKKCIMIDEYQDFSKLFLEMVNVVRERCAKAQLFCVGDDWQAINGFAGAEVRYFKEFEKFFEGARRREITTNYRSAQKIVKTAKSFMRSRMREEGNFKAFEKDEGVVEIVEPEVLILNDDEMHDVKYRELAAKMTVGSKWYLEKVIKEVVWLIKKNAKAKKILLLHRKHFLGDIAKGIMMNEFYVAVGEAVVFRGIMTREAYAERVEMMTMHQSKGLEAEVVIILSADDEVVFERRPERLLYGAFGETAETVELEQVRLFYVAMTRARKKLYILRRASNEKLW